MNLTVNLSDRTEVAAAAALLAAILGGALEDGITRIHPIDNPEHGEMPATEAFRQPAALPADVTPVMNPAATFGGAAVQLPPGVAPVTAAAEAGALPLASGGGFPVLGAAAPAPAPAHMITPQAAALGLPPAAPAGVELDKDGLPWDERIHAGTKTKNADGRWKAKKGLNDPAKKKQIEAELLARMQGGAALPLSPAASPAAAPQVAAQPLPAVGALTVPGVSPAADPTTFEALMQRLMPQVSSGAVPGDALPRVCAAIGVNDVVGLQANPQMVPTAWGTLKANFPSVQ